MPRSLHGGSTRTRSNAVVALRLGGVGRTHVDDVRAHTCGRAAQRVGAAGVALDGDDLALRWPSARRGAWSCRRARRTGRARARRAAGVEQLRDGHRGARLRHQQARSATRASRTRRTARRGSARRPSVRVGTGRRSASASGAILSVLARSDGLGGLVVGGHQRAGVGRAERVEPQLGDPLGMRVGERGLRRACGRAALATSGRASRAARRRTALTSPAPRGASALASSTDSPTAACAGHAVQEGQLEDAEPQRGQHRRVELRRRPARRAWRSRDRAWPRAGRSRR